MDVENIFHMKGGDDETSYSKNSSLQKKAADMVKHIIKETIEEVYLTTTPQTHLSVADFGCSSTPNTLSMIKDLHQTIENAHHKAVINGQKSNPPPQICVYLNDLPTNDFNAIFRVLPEFLREDIGENGGGSFVNIVDHEGCDRPSLFVAACPGSFYGAVFPRNFLHFVYSSYSLHWLSKVPPGIYDEHGKSMNKGCVYICKESPPSVILAYAQQFQKDFSQFLKLRSEELTKGGKMVLIFLGREDYNHFDRGNTFLWQLLATSFNILVSKGVIEEEKVNSYDVHFYAPCKEEIEKVVKREGSFKMEHLEVFEIEREEEYDVSYGMAVASTVRAIQESMITHHFGEHILDAFFQTYAQLVDQEMSFQKIRPITFILVLTKLGL